MTSFPIRLIAFVIIGAVLTLASTSCNTARGVGRDVRHVGSHIENAAN